MSEGDGRPAGKTPPTQREREALAEAVRRAVGYWDLADELEAFLGGPPNEVLRAGPSDAVFERARLLAAIFLDLDAIMGRSDAAARVWLRSHNTDLDGTPAALMRKRDGLEEVMHYLDAARHGPC